MNDNRDISNKLKKCPFCGHVAFFKTTKEGEGRKCLNKIRCTNCPANMKTVIEPELAIEVWNKREYNH